MVSLLNLVFLLTLLSITRPPLLLLLLLLLSSSQHSKVGKDIIPTLLF